MLSRVLPFYIYFAGEDRRYPFKSYEEFMELKNRFGWKIEGNIAQRRGLILVFDDERGLASVRIVGFIGVYCSVAYAIALGNLIAGLFYFVFYFNWWALFVGFFSFAVGLLIARLAHQMVGLRIRS